MEHTLKLNADQVMEFLGDVVPDWRHFFDIVSLEPMRMTAFTPVNTNDLRPGGTVSGPTLFGAADGAFYILTMAMIGKEALTVTTNCSIDFMRKPELAPIRTETRILKLGRTLSVGDVMLYSGDSTDPVSHANITYSIPPKRD